jgi:hypothetical protein
MASPYDSFSPCTMKIAPTGGDGINSGRPRFKVECETCETVIHPATTGPLIRMKAHLEGYDPGEPAEVGAS